MAVPMALVVTGAWAQDLDAGKSGAQLFAQDCAACHRSPHGLAKTVGGGALAGFLRQHYTSGSESANVVAAYVLGLANSRTERPKGRAGETQAKQPPATPRERSRIARPSDLIPPEPVGSRAGAAARHDRVARPSDASVDQPGRHSRKSRRVAPAEPSTRGLPAEPAAPDVRGHEPAAAPSMRDEGAAESPMVAAPATGVAPAADSPAAVQPATPAESPPRGAGEPAGRDGARRSPFSAPLP